MASFQVKIGWKMMRKKENKNYRSISFLNDAQKRKKFKNTIICLLSKPKQVGKGGEREKIKIIVPLRSFPTGYRKF